MTTTPLIRNKQPRVTPFESLTMPMPRIETLPNGITLYIIDKGDQELNRLDILFDGGRYVATTPAIADLTGPMLRKGIPGMDENEIAYTFDFNGASLHTATTQHYSTITLFSLTRNLHTLLPVVAAMITSPTLPDKPFETLRQQRSQQLLINREKVRILAGESFNRLIFGDNHPYARTTTPQDLQQVTIENLREYHKAHYADTRIRIILSGHITPHIISLIHKHFGTLPCNNDATSSQAFTPIKPQQQHDCITHKPAAMQSAIRMGMPTIDFTHPHYPALTLLNLILGGYFGSRLMTNIREEKGYTYGISSHIISTQHTSYFTIVTETGTQYTRQLIEEVRNEMMRLCNEKISHEELETARNYMQGQRARSLDSPYTMSDYLLSSLISGNSIEYFNHEDKAIRSITPDDLIYTANTYLHPHNLYTAIAGDEQMI